ncbi:uncharacterized protein LOC117169383 [Belonocnema kinseyi]|uniref:uncharacterized protein LOC117169383 n=1 Tax=Belonocnema kinseyi TaxID=2817044 RepID=UPI00143CDCEB|nr:uncharacterized protein LOC117169383 [Belonocnema kinseyi]
MHAVGLHSALAIKRQRKRRDEQRRARERRYSIQSGESGLTSPRASTGSLDHHPRHHKMNNSHRAAGQSMVDSKVVTSIGMLHIGVVFVVLGAFLLASGLLPGDFASWGTKATGGWWNELVATGLFAVFIGIFLIILNRVIAQKEENDLEEYVQRQLTRSKSGHRLEKDLETGGLTTRHGRRAKQMKSTTSSESIRSQDDEKGSISLPRSPPPAYSPTSPIVSNGDHIIPIQSAVFLEQITEEETISDRFETSTTNSISPGSPCETRELIQANSKHCRQNGTHNSELKANEHLPLYVHISRI